MLVQLRRVVYLLVLLQCCVCVVYANSGTDSTQNLSEENITAINARLTECTRKTYDLHNSRTAIGETLKDRVRRANQALSSASEAVDKANALIETAKAGTQNGRLTGKGDESGSEDLMESLRAAEKANKRVVAQLESVVREIDEYHKKAVEKAKEGSVVTEELAYAIGNYSRIQRGKEDYVLKAAEQALEGARGTVDELRGAIKTADTEKPKIDTELESLKKSMKQIEEDIEKLSVPQAPQTTLQQEGERTKEVVTSRENAAEGGVNPQKGTEGMNENTESAEKPANAIPNEQNETQGDKNEEQSATEKPNETLNAPSGAATGGSQKPTTPPNTAPDTANTGSGGVTSGIVSGGSLHHNVSGLSDNSNSPAVLHSPLLLLLLCVLGCILVC